METYKVFFKDNNTEGVFGISLVDSPAMESNFIALTKQQKVELKVIDEEKMILLGAVLIPDKPIYRNQGGKEFNIVFPEKTVRLAMENFLRNGYQKNSTLEHDENLKLSNVTFVEHWIKEDEVHDKSVKYGINEKIGTWFTVMKAHDKETYEKIKQKNGFSIDGFFDLEKVNLKSDYMNIKEEFEKVLLSFGFKPKEEKEEVKLGKMMTKNGDVTIMFDGEELTQGAEVYTMVEDQRMAIPDGEYTLENEMILVVVDSKATEIKEMKVEEEVPTEMSEPTSPTGSTVKSEKSTHEVFYQLSSVLTKAIESQNEKIASLEAKLTAQPKEETKETVFLTKSTPTGTAEAPKNKKERLMFAINNVKNK
jgi:hypothetical protein